MQPIDQTGRRPFKSYALEGFTIGCVIALLPEHTRSGLVAGGDATVHAFLTMIISGGLLSVSFAGLAIIAWLYAEEPPSQT